MIVYIPGSKSGSYAGLTSAIDVMPTVAEIMGLEIPDWVEGASLLSKIKNPSSPGREYTISTVPFANPGDPVRSVDNIRRSLKRGPVTTVTSLDWSLLFSEDVGLSQLYDLRTDPLQNENVIFENGEIAGELHQHLVAFLWETGVSQHLITPRLKLRL